MDNERNEDLNPRSEDIEEKVRRMMDPNIPDDPVPDVSPVSKPAAEPPTNTPPQTTKTPDTEAPLSAPELPDDQVVRDTQVPPVSDNLAPPSARKSKKMIIPIDHQDEPDSTSDTAPTPNPESAEAMDTAEPAAPAVKQITIDDQSETTADIAEKLDEAIAELEPKGKAAKAAKKGVSSKQKAEKLEVSETAEPDQETADTLLELPADSGPKLQLVNSHKTQIPEPISTDAAELPITDPAVITDPETDKAVAAIVAEESDEILAVEDAVRDTDEPVVAEKAPRRSLDGILKSLFAKKAFRRLVVMMVLAGAVTAAVLPQSRYLLLNMAGVRVASSLTVLDDSTQQPLKNVQVSLGSASAVTDAEGKVSLRGVRLGKQPLTVQKRAFAPITKTLTMGWGSNPLGSVSLTPIGTQYSFTVTDFLSGKPLGKVEASTADASAVADDKGLIRLTLDKPGDQPLEVTLKLDGYRTEKISLNPDDKTTHSVKLVPARKHVFVSKRSGKYDIYSVYTDGQDEKLVLAGSGNEREEGLAVVPHPQDNVVAYVSTRAGQRNQDGFVLSNLLIINLDNNETTNVGASERIQIISWASERLVYVQIAAGASADTPNRYRLLSYNYKDGTSRELASSNFFNDVVGVGSTIYYAPSSAYQTGSTNFYRINADGSDKQTVFSQEVWNSLRTAYDHLALAVQQQWYDYRIGDKQPAKLTA